jgi:membrane protease subunit (stomatin/prohibitin family)
MRRRRPLAAAAMVGGASYLGARAGQNAAMNNQNEQAMEADQSARIAQLEQQQYAQQAAPAAPAAPAQSEMTTKLMELKNLHDQGVLTDDEFAAAKQKLIAEA